MGENPRKIYVDPDLRSLIPRFIELRKRDLENLEKFLSQKDVESIGKIAHIIKGNAGSYGFTQLGELAADLDKLTSSDAFDEMGHLIQQMKDIIYHSIIIFRLMD